MTATCVDGPRAASQQLRPGAAWIVYSSQALCVRREKLEGGERHKLAWERKEIAKGRIEEVEL